MTVCMPEAGQDAFNLQRNPVEKGPKPHTARSPIHTGFVCNSFTTRYTTATCIANKNNLIFINY